MTRAFVIFASLSLCFVVGRMTREPAVHAGAPACAPGTINGNVNDDGGRDIGDAIFLLNHFFLGGPPPCDNRSDLEEELAACRTELEQCRLALAECRGEEPLQWFITCGDPVCRGYQGPFEGIEVCTDQVEGTPCDVDGALCDLEDDCNRMLVCAREDPRSIGCPISKRRFKSDIRYLSDAEQDEVLDELLKMRLARWRYNWDTETAEPRMGFIIDDAKDAPAVTPDGERVDLYGYMSMAVAAIQSQQRTLDELTRQVKELEKERASKND